MIRQERAEDYREVEELTREAFWNHMVPGCDEHYLVHVMRDHEDFVPELAYVIEMDSKLVANVMYTKTRLVDENGETKHILSFGPLSVLPEYQRHGFGKALLETTFAKAKEMGYDVIANFGHPCNYVPRGFRSCKHYNVCLEGDVFPTALLVMELVPNVLDGKKWYFYESPVGELLGDTEAVARFDAEFPKKEKMWQPSQEEFYIYSHSQVVW